MALFAVASNISEANDKNWFRGTCQPIDDLDLGRVIALAIEDGLIPVVVNEPNPSNNNSDAKKHTCECGQVYWYVPGQAFACVNCFQIIYEDTDGVIHKVFGDE